jgi:hypothetical protein
LIGNQPNAFRKPKTKTRKNEKYVVNDDGAPEVQEGLGGGDDYYD